MNRYILGTLLVWIGAAGAAQLSPEGMQNIGVKTGVVERKQISDNIRATGTVDIDERQVAYVQVRFRGYIRKVFVNATYRHVRKGDPLFTIYSPDVAATERDYLNALEAEKRVSASTVEGVAAAAREVSAAAVMRLKQWEVSDAEIAKLRETGTLVPDLTIDSPVAGYITEHSALPNLYVEPSTRLYTVADLSRVWVYAQIFQDDIGRVRPGETARIAVDAYAGRNFPARVESILPQVDLTTRTVRVRLEVLNPGIALKPGMFVNVDLKNNLGKQLTIPAAAVLHSGTHELVYLSDSSGRMEPREVRLGARSGDDYIVLSGLKAGQQIVTSANFLIDSESQLQVAAGSYTPPPPGAGQASQSTQGAIDFSTTPAPPHKGSNVFHAKVSAPGGAPVDGADVTATFFMPAMPAMGMAAMTATAKLTGKGNGLYEGTGVLESGGAWRVTIVARKDGKIIANKQSNLNATGGM